MPDEGDRSADSDVSPFRLARRFLAARFALSMATQIQAVALGWYVYALTDSAFDLGLIGLAQFVPLAGLALPAGHIVDRYPRRAVAFTTFAVEMGCSLVLTALALARVGDAATILLVVSLYGACRAFEQPAMQSWLPTLVPAGSFARAAAANSLVSQAAVILGPAVGGVAYLLGPFVPLAGAAVMEAAALACVLGLSERRGGAEKLSWETLLGGVRFIAINEAVRGAISLDLFCVLFGGATALLPIFARDILAVGPAGLGLLRSAPAVGALITGVVLTRRPPQRQVGRRMMVTVAIYGAATVVFGVSHSLPLSLAALVVVGAADMLSVVIRQTMIQVTSPDAIRGRVSAVNALFTGTSNQLGQFESGVTAAWFGPVGSVALGGAATLIIVALWSRWFPALRRMDRLVMAEDAVKRARGARVLEGEKNMVS